jgi:branched-subunit amino acid transport protein AzlD
MVFAMGGVIFFCRAFPFMFFRGKPAAGENVDGRRKPEVPAFLSFVEKVVPPAAMTVLAVNNLGGTLGTDALQNLPALSAVAAVVFFHLWKRNSLLSIFGGTALYMILERIIIQK